MTTLFYPRTEDEHERVASWVMKELGVRAAKPYRAMALVGDNQRVVAGVVYNGYNGANVDITVYAPGHLTASAMAAVFRYAFDKLRCTRVTARTRRDNPLHRDQILTRMGFKQEATAPHYYGPRDDAIVYRMLRRECPWIGDRDGRPQGPGPGRYGGGASRDEQGNGYRPERAE